VRPSDFHKVRVWLLCSISLFGWIRAEAQDTVKPDSVLISLYVDGLPEVHEAPADSLRARADALVDSLREEGRYFASIDSLFDTSAFVSRGPLVRVDQVIVKGVDEAETEVIRLAMNTRDGRVLDPEVLEADFRAVLTRYQSSGYALASVSVEEIDLSPAGGLAITIQVSQGPRLRLERIELPGAERTSVPFVTRLVGHEPGAFLDGYNPELIRRRLEATGLFADVGAPELIIEPDTAAVLVIPLEESDPGNFDLVLGYLPPEGPGDDGTLVGQGSLELRNLVGGGRRISIELNRMPGSASSIDLRAADPFLLGLPLGLEGGFNGLEQDSTYGKQAYSGVVGYRFEKGLSASAGFSREVVRPGQAGLQLSSSGRQVIPRSDAWFIGLGMHFESLDRRVNPTKGLLIETYLETGSKEFTDRRIVGADTTSIIRQADQRRLQGSARLYMPVFRRQVVVLGGEGAVLLSDSYDRSDLFRFGGATSLRGYDEERFLGRIATRALAEYRFLIDRSSFAYCFIDVGYVDRPETPDLTPTHDIHPGYGIGIQFRTAIGLVNVSAALNPDSGPTDARIHAGLSFGL